MSLYSNVMDDAHKEARRLRDVHPLLKSRLPAYRVTFATALRFAWACHKRPAVIAKPATPAKAAADAAVFQIETKDFLTSFDFTELARLREAARIAA